MQMYDELRHDELKFYSYLAGLKASLNWRKCVRAKPAEGGQSEDQLVPAV